MEQALQVLLGFMQWRNPGSHIDEFGVEFISGQM